MRTAATLMLLMLATAFAPAAFAKSHKAGAPESFQENHHANYASGVARDAHGRIARDPRARNAFKRANPCPSTGRTSGSCPGYVIDHVHALKRGGPDTPANMQWQTEGAAKLKDRTE